MRSSHALYDPYDDPDWERHDQRRRKVLFCLVCVAVAVVVLFSAFGPDVLAKLALRAHGL